MVSAQQQLALLNKILFFFASLCGGNAEWGIIEFLNFEKNIPHPNRTALLKFPQNTRNNEEPRLVAILLSGLTDGRSDCLSTSISTLSVSSFFE